MFGKKKSGMGLFRFVSVMLNLAVASTQLFGIFSLILKMQSGKGNYDINLALLVISAIYFLISVIFCFVKVEHKAKNEVKKITRGAKKVTKFIGNAYNVGLTAYNVSLTLATGGLGVYLELIGCVGQGIALVLTILFELALGFAKRRVERLAEKFKQSAELIKNTAGERIASVKQAALKPGKK